MNDRNRSGQVVPLNTLADVQLVQAPALISLHNLYPYSAVDYPVYGMHRTRSSAAIQSPGKSLKNGKIQDIPTPVETAPRSRIVLDLWPLPRHQVFAVFKVKS